VVFCDTSTLAKYYVQEADSAAVRSRLDAEDSAWCSELGRAELMSVFHRQFREKKMDRAAFLTLVRQFQNDDVGGHWTWVPIDHSIFEQVTKTYATLPDTVFLRTADCIHLVTALYSGFSEIYTHDAVQSRAANALGLRTITIS